MAYDSRPETLEHIQAVRRLIYKAIVDLSRRALVHDQSKLESPEVEVFNEFTPKLKESTYGSPEYEGFRAAMKPALDHHYANNSHHPEFFKDGVRGMNLLDVVEMLCDWKAATLRHANGDIRKSIELNQKRFGYSDEFKQILLNTLPLIEAGFTEARYMIPVAEQPYYPIALNEDEARAFMAKSLGVPHELLEKDAGPSTAGQQAVLEQMLPPESMCRCAECGGPIAHTFIDGEICMRCEHLNRVGGSR